MQHALEGASLFARFHATVHIHKLCARPTTAPGSVVCGHSRRCVAMFDEADHEVVPTPSAGHWCQHWGHVYGTHQSQSGRCGRTASDAWALPPGWLEAEQSGGGLPGYYIVTWAVKATRTMCRRYHWSNASSRFFMLDLTVMSHISEPYSNAWFPPFRCRSAVAVSPFPLHKFRKNYVSAVKIILKPRGDIRYFYFISFSRITNAWERLSNSRERDTNSWERNTNSR